MAPIEARASVKRWIQKLPPRQPFGHFSQSFPFHAGGFQTPRWRAPAWLRAHRIYCEL